MNNPFLDTLQFEADARWPDFLKSVPPELKPFLPERLIIPGANISSGNPTAPRGEILLGNAVKHRGKPYVWGGDSISTFDCSALTQRAARDMGIMIGRTTYDQIHDGIEVPFAGVQIGDLVFSRFSDTDGVWETPEHVSIWAGNGKVFEAGNPIDFYAWGNRGVVRVRRIA